MGRFRMVMAAMLALALVLLLGAPMRHASAAPPASHHVVQHCAGHGEAAAPDKAAAPPIHQEASHAPCDRSGSAPHLAYCGSAQCPAMVALPSAPAAQPERPLPPSFPLAVSTAPGGLAVDPALRPPRPAA